MRMLLLLSGVKLSFRGSRKQSGTKRDMHQQLMTI